MIKARSSFPEDLNKIVILFVDDQQNNLHSFSTHFRRNKKYLILKADSAEEALSVLKVVSVQIIVTNQDIIKVTGVEFLKESIKKTSKLIKIFVTVHKDISPMIEAYNNGLIFQFLEAPWDFKDLEKLIDEAFVSIANDGHSKSNRILERASDKMKMAKIVKSDNASNNNNY
jgi:response regulator RpfG family c-di-GMP phosphodiesterase